MSGVIAAVAGSAVVGAGASYYAGQQANDAIGEASDSELAFQQQGLDYLKETDAAPMYYRDAAQSQLAGFYGLPQYQQTNPNQTYLNYTPEQQAIADQIEAIQAKAADDTGGSFKVPGFGRMRHGEANRVNTDLQRQIDSMATPQQNAQSNPVVDPNGQQRFVDRVQASPFYNSMISQGEDAVARNASVTGGMRSGNIQPGLAQNSQNVLQNLTNQQLQGLFSFAGTPSNANAISAQYNGMGNTTGAGMMGQAQAMQDMYQGIGDSITGGLNNYAQYRKKI